MSNTQTQAPSTTHQHPSTRGVHYLYLADSKNRLVGCIATVRKGSDLFIGTSFCSGRNGDTFRKSQGRTIAEGRANRRAEEQDKIMQVFSSKSVDQTSDGVQFLTRAQHALRVNLELLNDCTVDQERPNAFDVLKAILQSVIEFDSDLDDRFDGYLAEGEQGPVLDLADDVIEYFQNLDLPGGLVRAARRKLNAVSVEANTRESADLVASLQALARTTTPSNLQTNNTLQTFLRATGVLGPVVPPSIQSVG
jgi:hypothetical protein